MSELQKHSAHASPRKRVRGVDRFKGLPKWKEVSHDPDEVEKLSRRAQQRFEEIKDALKSEHPNVKLVIIDADTGAMTLGEPGDDEVEVARKHYSNRENSPRAACLFRL